MSLFFQARASRPRAEQATPLAATKRTSGSVLLVEDNDELVKNASVVPAPNLRAAADMLTGRTLDVFATNKAILFQLSDGLPGSRVLNGRWGLEHLAIAIPKGREQAMAYMSRATCYFASMPVCCA